MAYLAWVWSLRGPTPEKWPELLKDVTNKTHPHLSLSLLKPEYAHLPLAKLAKLYPYEKAKANAA